MNKVLNFFVVVSLLVITLNANAQIKVHSDGHLSIGTLSSNWEIGTHIYSSGWAVFNTSLTTPWHIVTMANPGVETGKCWIVTHPTDHSEHRFYVTGYGTAYARAFVVMSNSNLQSGIEPIENAGETLDQIIGIWYTPIDELENKNTIRRIGIDAQSVKKALPEAVTADENDVLYINHDALTAFLIEAVKEQRKEIQQLRKILDENGLLK